MGLEKADLPLAQALAGAARPAGWINLVVGPEGGFSDAEASWGRERGARLVSLGPLRLRTPMACFHLISSVRAWREGEKWEGNP